MDAYDSISLDTSSSTLSIAYGAQKRRCIVQQSACPGPVSRQLLVCLAVCASRQHTSIVYRKASPRLSGSHCQDSQALAALLQGSLTVGPSISLFGSIFGLFRFKRRPQRTANCGVSLLTLETSKALRNVYTRADDKERARLPATGSSTVVIGCLSLGLGVILDRWPVLVSLCPLSLSRVVGLCHCSLIHLFALHPPPLFLLSFLFTHSRSPFKATMVI